MRSSVNAIEALRELGLETESPIISRFAEHEYGAPAGVPGAREPVANQSRSDSPVLPVRFHRNGRQSQSRKGRRQLGKQHVTDKRCSSERDERDFAPAFVAQAIDKRGFGAPSESGRDDFANRGGVAWLLASER